MDRKDFLKSGLLLSTIGVLPTNSVFAENILTNGIDKLVDEKGNFVHQPLPYSNTFLEPFMDEETMHLHYTFHHGNAVKSANKYLQRIKDCMEKGDYDNADFYTKKLTFQSSSHILHSIFWTNLTNVKNEPKGDLLKRIEKQFGSYDKLKGLLGHLSKNIDGNGWGILGYQPYFDSLTVLQCENHDKLTQWGVIPLLIIDVWEHAYYLKFRNKKDAFVDNIFSIINWDNVADRLERAQKIVQ
jgi:superoxide dismutase, Fe-Mn family